MTQGEKRGVVIGAVAVAAGLQVLYRKRGWQVPTPLWLAVTALTTYAGFHGYKALTVK